MISDDPYIKHFVARSFLKENSGDLCLFNVQVSTRQKREDKKWLVLGILDSLG